MTEPAAGEWLDDVVELRRAGDATGALRLLRERATPDDMAVRWKSVKVAGELRLLGQLDEADAIYARAIEQQPDHFHALIGRALVLKARGQREPALAAMLALSRVHPSRPQPSLEAAALLEAAGRHAEAATQLDFALRADPRNAPARLRRANLLVQLDAPEAAWRDLAELAQLGAEPAGGKAVLARVARALGLHAEAAKAFEEAAAAGADTALDRAQALVHLEDFTAARDALSREPRRRRDWQAVALELDEVMRTDEGRASDWFADALAAEERPEHLLALVRHGWQWGLHRVAIARLRRYLAGRPAGEAGPERMVLARCELQIGEFDEALEVLAEFDASAASADVLLDIAELSFELGDGSSGRRALEMAARLWRSTAPLPRQLQRAVSLADHRSEPAVRDELLSLEGAPVRMRRMLEARLHVEQGRWPQAEGLVAQEQAADPLFPADRWRARLALEGGELEAALVATERRLAASPLSLEDFGLAIRALVDAEEVGRAWDVLQRFESRFAARDLVPLRARLLELDLRLEEETEMLQQAVRRNPGNAAAAGRLAARLLDSGHLAGAGAVIDTWGSRLPTDHGWLRARLAWGFEAYHDWEPQLQLFDEVWHRATPRTQPLLRQEWTEYLMQRGLHDEADAVVDDFRRAIPGLATARSEKLSLQINSTQRLAYQGRHAEARAAVDALLAQPLSARLQDALHLATAAIEAFGGGDAARYVEHRNRARLSRHHVTLTPFTAAPATPPLRAAVLLHLFYPEMWPEFRDYLRNLDGTAHELFITVDRGAMPDAVIRDILAFAPSATITPVQNRGFDVGAHWQSLGHVNLERFDIAVLLQTKKNRHTRVGPAWRKNLLDALMGTPERWRDNLATFAQRPDVGVIASGFHCHTADVWQYGNMKAVFDALGMPTRFDEVKRFYRCVSGTMFMVRAGLLAEMHAKTRGQLVFEPYRSLSLLRRIDRSLAHAMERALTLYPAWRGFETVWRA